MASPTPSHQTLLPPLYRNLAAHNVRTSLHYTQLRTVSDPTEHIGDSFLLHPTSHSETLITKENAKCLIFPRVQRAKTRVKEIEQRVEQEMSSKFEGLTDDQRESVLMLVSNNTLLRSLNEKAIATRKKRHSMEQQQQAVLPSANDLVNLDIPDFLVHEYLLIGEKEKQKEEEERRRRDQKRFDDEMGDEEDETDGKISSSRSLNHRQVNQNRRPELTPRAKYCKMVSQVIQQENSGHAQSPQQQQQQQQQQQDSNNPPGFEEMKRVTKSLYDWSQNMINAPINLFDNKNLPQITPNTIMPPQARNNTPPKSSSNLNENSSLPAPQQQQQQLQQGSSLSPETAATSAQNLQQPSSSNNISQPNDPTSLSPSGNPAASQQTLLADSQQQPAAPAQQETIYGEFDVLLNACKPVAAESKLSIRLNVMQETNPPQALIKSLKENLGYDIKTHVETIKVEEVEHSIRGFSFAFPANKSTDAAAAAAAAATLSNKRRHQYGNWYIKPSMWNEYMVKSGAEKNPKPREKMGGLVQQKLDAIMVNRAKEEAAFQAALLQSFGPPPPPPPPTAAPVQQGQQGQQGQGQQGVSTTAHSRGSRVDADASAAAAAAGGGGGGGFAGISRQVSRQVSRQASRQSSFANLLQQEGGGGVGGGAGAPGKSAGGRSLSTLKREQSKSQASIASVPE